MNNYAKRSLACSLFAFLTLFISVSGFTLQIDGAFTMFLIIGVFGFLTPIAGLIFASAANTLNQQLFLALFNSSYYFICLYLFFNDF